MSIRNVARWAIGDCIECGYTLKRMELALKIGNKKNKPQKKALKIRAYIGLIDFDDVIILLSFLYQQVFSLKEILG